MHRRRLLFTFTTLIILAGLFSACTGMATVQPPAVSVSPAFAPLYETCGGESDLGPPITSQFTQGGYVCQYFYTIIMCSPVDTPSEISFVRLGEQYNLYPYQKEAGAVMVDPSLMTRYAEVCGSALLGSPVSNLNLNPSTHQWEQYFVNGALSYGENSSPESAQIMPLAYHTAIKAKVAIANIPPLPTNGTTILPISEPFIQSLASTGLAPEIGLPLTAPYTTPDGQWEQVYEGAVLIAPIETPDVVRLHRAALPARMPTTELLDMLANYDTNLSIFIPVDPVSGKGHYVPMIFNNYVAAHGGYEWSGLPISTYVELAGGDTVRQCFENYCLDYHRGTGQISLARDLGIQYIKNTAYAPVPAGSTEQTVELVLLNLSETLRAGQVDIEIIAINTKTTAPLIGLGGQIDITQKDGTIVSYPLQPTDATGTTRLTLAIPAGYFNAEIVVYKVCVNLPGVDPICQVDSYLVWGQ